jgi:hypothetical protein
MNCGNDSKPMRQNVFGEKFAYAGRAKSSVMADLDRAVDQCVRMSRVGFAAVKKQSCKVVGCDQTVVVGLDQIRAKEIEKWERTLRG